MAPNIVSDAPHYPILSTTLRITQGVIGTRHADSTVLLDPKRGVYYTLNETGGRVWEQIGAGVPLRDVVRTLCEEYGVPVETIETDVARLVETLFRAALVERVEA